MQARFHKLLRHRAAPWLLAAYFFFDLACIAGRPWTRRSITGEIVQLFFDSKTRSPRRAGGIIVRLPDGTLALLHDYNGQQFPPPIHQLPAVHYYRFMGGPQVLGLYSPVVRRERWHLSADPHPAVTAVEQAQFTKEFIDAHLAHGVLRNFSPSDAQARLFATGKIERYRVLPLGILHDLLSLTMLGLLCTSIRMQPPRRRKYVDPDRCGWCGYSTIGLTTNTCPECGKPIT